MADGQGDSGAGAPHVAIACQGGGSHAAFGAGVLHRLLEDHGRRYQLVALSGTSGGAVNAALAWSGLIQEGPALAQARLEGLWRDLQARDPVDATLNFWGQMIAGAPCTVEVSPYVWDLGARAEMERLLRKWVRLDRMPAEAARLNAPGLFVGATDIRNGAAVAIRGDGTAVSRPRSSVSLQPEPFDYPDILASLAIPPLYRAEVRRGTAFWDGLFSINPPVHALTNVEPRPEEIWVIRINPQRAAGTPTSVRAIDDRRNELSGNLALNKELDMIETVNGWLTEGSLDATRYKPIRVRIVGIEASDPGLSLATKFDRSPALIERLFALGRDRAGGFYKDASDRARLSQREREASLLA